MEDRELEKIIDRTAAQIQEMEVVKTKSKKAKAEKFCEVPEIVIPKTRAEIVEEAVTRLETPAVAHSKAFIERSQKMNAERKASPEERKHPLKIQKEAKTLKKSALEERIEVLRKNVERTKFVGTPDELVPFCWRMPLKRSIARPTKKYRQILKAEIERSLLLPAHIDN